MTTCLRGRSHTLTKRLHISSRGYSSPRRSRQGGEQVIAKYRKKQVLIEATQWFKNGDHPEDESTPIDSGDGPERLTEGKVVRFFRSLEIPGGRFCPDCGNVMSKHGILEVGLNGEEFICPGDYIVTRRDGSLYRMKAGEFESLYEPTRPPERSSHERQS